MAEERLTLREAAERAGITAGSLRQAVKRDRLWVEVEQTPRGPIHLTTMAAVEEYLAQRPEWAVKGAQVSKERRSPRHAAAEARWKGEA